MRSLVYATLSALLCACQSYVAVPVQPATLVAVAQHSRVKVANKADILLVVDDSYSMSGKQERLSAALQNFTAALDQLQPPVDYQVAVTTTSVDERFGACGPPGDPNAAAKCDSDWGATGFSCDSGYACLRSFANAGKLYQASGVPAVILRRRDYSATQFASYLAAAVKVGVDGARQPQGMEAMKLALTDPASGLVRDGAKIVVAFLSDAEDCSDPAHRGVSLVIDPKTGNVIDKCAQESAGDGSSLPSLEPVATYVNFLRNLKNSDGNAKEVEIATLVSLSNGTQDPGLCSNPACDAECDSATGGRARCDQRCGQAPTYQICMNDCLAECHMFCGGESPSRRYLELAFAFEGVAANICSDDASPALARVAAVIGIPKQVLLRARPQSLDTMFVRVNRGGQIVDCALGQGFDLVQTSEGQAVKFQGSCALQPDDLWDVRYLTSR
ncbi:MAG: hypothetical protein E6J78_14790 [Deltaproteobacteria bacterium]|nr:MAG: hypothetical protein E6J78_14790 [Deltaproteobacteria bacterium]